MLGSHMRQLGRRMVSSQTWEGGISLRAGEAEGLAIVSMDRQANRNALSRQFLADLRTAFDTAAETPETRAIVLTSSVPRVFCAGADLRERRTMTEDEVRVFVRSLRDTFSHIEALPKPTLAVIEGVAVGGGLELALAADMRIGGPTAKVGLVETRLAIIPGAGGTQRLPRLIGAARAKELMFTAAVLDAESAADYGILSHVADNPLAKATEIAAAIAPNGPLAVVAVKTAVNKGMQCSALADAMAVEAEAYNTVIPTKDRLEGLAAFAEKRKPVYRGH